MFVPLSVCIVYLCSRFPDACGMYAWSARAFGPFAGFITGWTYWTGTLAFLPTVLYFIAGSSCCGHRLVRRPLARNLLRLFLADHDRDLPDTECSRAVGGQVLNSAGAIARWLGTLLLVGFALGAAGVRAGNGHQSAHDRARISAQRRHFLDDTRFRLDRARSRVIHGRGDTRPSTHRSEGIDFRRTLIAAVYIIGTASILLAIPPAGASGVYGVIEAIRHAAAHLGLNWLVPRRSRVRSSRPRRQPVFMARGARAHTSLSRDCRLLAKEFRPNSPAARLSGQRDLGAIGACCGPGPVGSEWDVGARCIQCPH